MIKQTHLYRHYDKDDNLLYVGISLSAYTRLSQHKGNSEWAKSAIKMTTELFDSREEALEAEKKAIIDEHPLFNVVHKSNKSKDQEPDYLRVYVENVSVFAQVDLSITMMLLPLVSIMTNDNMVDVRNELRKDVAVLSGISVKALSNRLTKLVALKAIKKVGIGRYMINPFLYDRSDCKSIKNLRKKFLSIEA